ncbi:MAG TPA: hypothetical protein VMF31_03415 [Solirubrobacterales bacterium]|nr:hypothetical protein [Solirubrobacterales bacterium]
MESFETERIMRWTLGVLLLSALLVLSTSAVAEAKTYRANMVIAPTGWCMIKAGGGIGCSSPAIPAMTDGYAWIRKQGRTHLGDTGNLISPVSSELPSNPPQLRRGDRWNKRGVRCRVIPGGIKCSNGKHGFRLKKRGYRVW